MAPALSLVVGGGDSARIERGPKHPRAAFRPPSPEREGDPFVLPAAGQPTLAELFAASPRDGGWAGFLLPQIDWSRPLLWVQERMAILEAGRVHPPGLVQSSIGQGLGGQGLAGRGSAVPDLIHVEARDARDALWAMEEGIRCPDIGAVIGELWGDPAALDFTATRRLAVAAEAHGVAAFLVRLSGLANLSGARSRWRVASAPSLANRFNPRAPGAAAWDAELFRARGARPGRWRLATQEAAVAGPLPAGSAHEPGAQPPLAFRVVADAGDRPLEPPVARTG